MGGIMEHALFLFFLIHPHDPIKGTQESVLVSLVLIKKKALIVSCLIP